MFLKTSLEFVFRILRNDKIPKTNFSICFSLTVNFLTNKSFFSMHAQFKYLKLLIGLTTMMPKLIPGYLKVNAKSSKYTPEEVRCSKTKSNQHLMLPLSFPTYVASVIPQKTQCHSNTKHIIKIFLHNCLNVQIMFSSRMKK